MATAKARPTLQSSHRSPFPKKSVDELMPHNANPGLRFALKKAKEEYERLHAPRTKVRK